jgi:16S rRNA (cytosine1402-N4)-methyltransferase
MNQQQNITAKHIINEYNEEKLSFILKEYGEISSAFKVAKAIVQKRNISTINTTSELVSVLQSFTPPKFANKFYAQVFQALRIEVNEELESLKQFLISTSKALKPGGRLVIITYHSLEDRLVKNFFKNGDFSDDDTADFIYGTKKSVFSLINKKVITPSEPEIKLNSRARSAKLRIAEKL